MDTLGNRCLSWVLDVKRLGEAIVCCGNREVAQQTIHANIEG